ncbi:GNAT family N-acetyltransferase [Phaeobacter sp. HF9A]|uniref:GNAT family N-acetyltransferase n=1 Tax=Phaeobacter sp. HF9A TaxID=2721561 RepID=UPI0034C6A137
MTETQNITFLRLTRADHDLVRHIAVAPEQIVYCGTVDMAFASDEAGIDLYAIRQGATCVGFFKIDLKYPQTHAFARAGDLGVRALMIDHQHQGKGLGTAALRALPAALAGCYRDAKAVVLTVNLRNQIAVRSYLNAGFHDTGELFEGGLAGPQHVMRCNLPAPDDAAPHRADLIATGPHADAS